MSPASDSVATAVPAPFLFLAATGLILVALLRHTWLLYGRRDALRIVLSVLAIATFKESVGDPSHLYVVTLKLMTVGGVPVGVIAGWLIVTLLGIEWSRRLTARYFPATGNTLLRRGLWMGIFGAVACHALEPIGQVSGWWIWTGDHFPYAPDERWFGVVSILGMIALGMAAFGPRRAIRGTAIGLAMIAGLAWLRDGPAPAQGLASVAIIASLVWFARRRRFALPRELLHPLGEAGLSRSHRLAPARSAWAIVATLAYYALQGPHPGTIAYTLPFVALLSASALAFRRPRESVIEPTPALDSSAAPTIASPRPA